MHIKYTIFMHICKSDSCLAVKAGVQLLRCGEVVFHGISSEALYVHSRMCSTSQVIECNWPSPPPRRNFNAFNPLNINYQVGIVLWESKAPCRRCIWCNENHRSQVGSRSEPAKAWQQVTGPLRIVLWFNTSET